MLLSSLDATFINLCSNWRSYRLRSLLCVKELTWDGKRLGISKSFNGDITPAFITGHKQTGLHICRPVTLTVKKRSLIYKRGIRLWILNDRALLLILHRSITPNLRFKVTLSSDNCLASFPFSKPVSLNSTPSAGTLLLFIIIIFIL